MTKNVHAEPLSDDGFDWGTTVFSFNGKRTHWLCRGMQDLGYCHMTVQVFKVDIERTEPKEMGTQEGNAPVTISNTARASFMTDPENNWIEI